MRPTYIRPGAVLLLCAALGGGCAKGENDDPGGGGADAGRLPDAGPRPDAGPDFDSGPTGGAVTLTQSTSLTITDDNSVACTDTDTGFNTPASYFRVFDLASEGITTPLAVTQVSFGIETAAGNGGDQPAAVKIHALNGALTNANLGAPVGTANISIADQDLQVLDVPVTGTIPVGSKLVVELAVPDGAEGNALYIGTNAAGEDGPTYTRDECGGAEEPATMDSLGVTGMHWVLSVEGTK